MKVMETNPCLEITIGIAELVFLNTLCRDYYRLTRSKDAANIANAITTMLAEVATGAAAPKTKE